MVSVSKSEGFSLFKFYLGGVMKKESDILNLIKEPLMNIGIQVDSVSFVRENNNNFLRIIIKKDNYVDVDDCVNATKIINPIIDETNIINDSYILDVCSKGDDKNGR
jgi:ribosome maturation factor RimP